MTPILLLLYVLNDLRNAVLDDENCDGQDDVKSECL